MKKIVRGLLMGALATGTMVAVAPAAQAAQYANLEDCQAAAKRKVDERISQGDIQRPQLHLQA